MRISSSRFSSGHVQVHLLHLGKVLDFVDSEVNSKVILMIVANFSLRHSEGQEMFLIILYFLVYLSHIRDNSAICCFEVGYNLFSHNSFFH